MAKVRKPKRAASKKAVKKAAPKRKAVWKKATKKTIKKKSPAKNKVAKKKAPAKKKAAKKKVAVGRFNPNLGDPLSSKSAKAIIKAIKAHTEKHAKLTSADHSLWYCGITNDPKKRHSSHQFTISDKPHAWEHWNAYSRRIAEAIETYCHNKLGMKDKDTKGGSATNSKWIYVYKKHKTILD